MFNWEHHDYSNMSIEQLRGIREYALWRVEGISQALRDSVREEHAAGIEISELAKKAGVSRQAITAWLK